MAGPTKPIITSSLFLPDQERDLVEEFGRLPFSGFEFRGFLGKRRTVSFGWRYDFTVRELQQAEDIPTYLLYLRERAAEFAGLLGDQLQQTSAPLGIRSSWASAGGLAPPVDKLRYSVTLRSLRESKER
jgi:hypothetical protein